MSGAPLAAESVHKRYGDTVALRGASLEIPINGAISLTGASGSGKSTLLRCLAGLETPDEGRILRRGAPITTMSGTDRHAFHGEVQLLLQDSSHALHPRWTALELVREPLDIRHPRMKIAEREHVARQWLERLQLPPDAHYRTPSALSGGQRRRVLLARSLALKPNCLLLDEPLAGLDLHLQAEILLLLKALRADCGVSMLLVTHDIDVAAAFAVTVCVMQRGEVVDRFTPRGFRDAARHEATRRLVRSLHGGPSARLAANDSGLPSIKPGANLP